MGAGADQRNEGEGNDERGDGRERAISFDASLVSC